VSNLKTGTKSILFGVHQFFIHPLLVAQAWSMLYGFPFDPRLWLCFFVHDLGYFGKPNMDGPEGEKHVLLGANIMRVFGKKWHDECLYHSRFYAKQNNAQFSRLCVADKLSIVIIPYWLYLPFAWISGELKEYMVGRASRTSANGKGAVAWLKEVQEYVKGWVDVHKDLCPDGWIKLADEGEQCD